MISCRDDGPGKEIRPSEARELALLVKTARLECSALDIVKAPARRLLGCALGNIKRLAALHTREFVAACRLAKVADGAESSYNKRARRA
jgi:hypothetical protein